MRRNGARMPAAPHPRVPASLPSFGPTDLALHAVLRALQGVQVAAQALDAAAPACRREVVRGLLRAVGAAAQWSAGAGVRYRDGGVELTFACATRAQKLEDWIEGLVRALTFYGGAAERVGRWILARLRHQRFDTVGEADTAIAGPLPGLNERPFQTRRRSRRG